MKSDGGRSQDDDKAKEIEVVKTIHIAKFARNQIILFRIISWIIGIMEILIVIIAKYLAILQEVGNPNN